jgi:membrane-associated phospholipid phosphatase
MKLTGRTLALAASATLAGVAFAAFARRARRGELDKIDTRIANAIYELDTPAADVVLKTATKIGTWPVQIPVLAAAAFLMRAYPKMKVAIAAGAGSSIFLIGLSRVYLGVHWPLDVVAGFAAGVPPLASTVLSWRKDQA